jgi:hypothetical protein
MINEDAIRRYVMKEFADVDRVDIRRLGAGVQGAGFLVEMTTAQGPASYVVKGLFPQGLGHDYPSDRAGVFLLDLDEFGNLPRHVLAKDVLAELEDGTIKSIGGGKEYYLLMERAEGTDYFTDLESLRTKTGLDDEDRQKIRAMARYLGEIHSVKRQSRSLYWRKIRDTIGHGECLMGVFDTYPDGTMNFSEMAEIEKSCIDWRAKLKAKEERLCQIHGDFHPGNIWFADNGEFVLLDRSRGPWGEAADDVTALAINYVFFSLRYHGEVKEAYLDGFTFFFDEYLRATGDEEVLSCLAPFFAFRGVVVANPIFYPAETTETRQKLFTFVRKVLSVEIFDPNKVNQYIEGGSKDI